MFFNFGYSIFNAYAGENLAQPLADGQNRLAGAVANFGVMPAQTYPALYPEYNLPRNEDKIIVPTKKSSAVDLQIFASSSMAIDKKSGAILWNKNSGEPRPIASITKLMTAEVFLNTNPDWDKVYQLAKEDIRSGGKSYIYPGDEVKVKDLFYLMLVGSDNTAAVALAKSTGLSEEEFVARMNERAKQFGLENTFFADVSGLSSKNISPAKEVLIMARKCLAKQEIRAATLESTYEFTTTGGRKVAVQSTDYLLSAFPVDGINIVGGKTGHTDEAGYCFVGDFKNEAGQEMLSVVMGTGTNEDRFAATKKLVKWAYDSYSWTQ